ncbi:beta-galactosidase [Waltera sp.]|jgi:beta-galactosidase|uniref:beta-galactosidase n=1 Tax=Waltera sp. TaxID=2815806 RepID=UPI000E681795
MKNMEKEVYSYNSEYLTCNARPILPIMGEFHFSRYPEGEWKTAIKNMQQGGVDIVATYVFWIHHEEAEGEWDFSGRRNLKAFLSCCQEAGMKVWLRIGPWAHGECRNGGFPDWLVEKEKRGKLSLRTDDPQYLKYVDLFFTKIAEQADGYMHKDDGPVIGIQIENEYGHAGGPSDREEGMAHMRTLRAMAEKKGLTAPYFSATGWGGAYVPENFLPVLGGYVDAPWANHTHELAASENFLFQPFHDDANIASDFAEGQSGFTFDTSKFPYLTAELGGGLQVTARRRTYPYPEDIEAQTICMLGAGANLIGYYMYHGGVNPDGQYTTLQESKATGYANDLPVKSYDFQTCLRENGLPSESYYRLRKHHIFIKNTEELLAPAKVYLPDNIPEPMGAEDMETLRAAFRYNKTADCGFLFINNHQRKRKMTEKQITPEAPLKFAVPSGEGEKKQIIFDRLCVRTDAILVLPYNLPVVIQGEELRLCRTNASFLGCFGEIYYFYTEEDPENVYFEWSDGKDHAGAVKILTTHDAEHFLYTGDEDGGKVSLLPDLKFTEAGEVQMKDTGQAAESIQNVYGRTEPEVYELTLKYGKRPADTLTEDVWLELDFGGDCARLYQDGKLLDDWFSNGELWRVALKRYGYPTKLTLELDPFKPDVYYDLPPKKENRLAGARLLWLS